MRFLVLKIEKKPPEWFQKYDSVTSCISILLSAVYKVYIGNGHLHVTVLSGWSLKPSLRVANFQIVTNGQKH